GDTWRSASGSRVFDFLMQENYCIALPLVLTEQEQTSLYEQSEGSISAISVPGSIFLLLADRLDLRPTQLDTQWVEQYIAGPAEDDGVDLEIVRQSLEQVSVFQLGAKSIFATRTSGKYIANYICTFDRQFTSGTLLTPRSLDLIREIFLQEKYHLVENNFFSAMATPVLQHSFLEIYRILEFVFVLPRAGALLTQLKSSSTDLRIEILDFAKSCNRELGWKRIERDSIGRLFREYAVSNYSAFQQLTQECTPFSGIQISLNDADEHRNASLDKIVDKYYTLRNQIVHQFWPEEEITCTSSDWQALIEFTLDCVSYFYKRYLSKTQ
ncbi:MAG TPA: hypothetical protein VMA55_10925, partial [Acidovorax sp.]|nr:hypothetical protein [Acidovorax sp.]